MKMIKIKFTHTPQLLNIKQESIKHSSI